MLSDWQELEKCTSQLKPVRGKKFAAAGLNTMSNIFKMNSMQLS
jgi:hypothetical protein